MRITVLAVIMAMVIGCRSTPPPVTPQVPESELGDKAFGGGDYSQAVEYYNMWLTKYPQDADVFFQRGRAYYRMAKYDAALEDFSNSIRYYPKNLRAEVYSCAVLLAQEKYGDAKSRLAGVFTHPLFAKLPKYELYLCYLFDGSLKNKAGDYMGALASLEEAIKTYDLHPDAFKAQGTPHLKRLALYERALSRLEMGDFGPELAADMEEYVAIKRQMGQLSAEDYKNLAMSLYLSNQMEKCRQVLVHLQEEDRKALAQAIDDPSMFGVK